MTGLPTNAQIEAIEVEGRALLVEAGAGTGKTWVLTQRFLRLLGKHPDWPIESLVAVTFTEKAAREMRTRIRELVEQAAAKAPSGTHWHERRAQLDRMQVGTIHSLCARILREHAIAAEIDPHFEVLDEQQADALKESAIELALQEIAEQNHPALELLSSLQVKELRKQLGILLDRRGTVQRLFGELPNPDELLARWRAGLDEMRHALWQELVAQDPDLPRAVEGVAAVPIPHPEDKLAPIVDAAKQGCLCWAKGDFAGACAWWKSIRTGRIGKEVNWCPQVQLSELQTWLKSLHSAAEFLIKRDCDHDVGPLDESATLALGMWRSLWRQLITVYDRLKAERYVLDFDDLEQQATRLLKHEPRDARLQAYLDSLHHVMVDEFQDTNENQRDIVYELADPHAGGRLFVVGDAKQSIYRFRQAQVRVFNRTAQEIRAATHADPVRLDESFRAHGRLVAAQNDLFAQLLRPQSGTEHAVYEAPPGPLRARRQSGQPQALAPVPVELWILPEQHADEARVYEARLLAERLLELQQGGFCVWDKDAEDTRPFRFGDAAILFRATTSFPLYEEQFKALGLPYLTVSGRGYYDRPEVRDLLALLAALRSPADDLNLVTALRSPLFGLSDEALYRLRWRDSQDCHTKEPRGYAAALTDAPPNDQPTQVAFAARTLARLWELAGHTDVWRLLRAALDETGYEATLVLSDNTWGGRRHSNVRKLLEMARQQPGSSLSTFLHAVEGLRTREAREGEALGNAPLGDAVTLMSVHAAKGLEFPVVVVADLGRPRGGETGSPHFLHDPEFGLACKVRDELGDWQETAGYAWAKWINGRMEEAESKRLLYVACTRAADLLILSGKPPGKEVATWLDAVVSGWSIPPSGTPEEILTREGYSIRVIRPAPPADERPAASKPTAEPEPVELAAMPPLALPVVPRAATRAISVTHLARLLAQDEADSDVPAAPRPAVRPARPGAGERAPADLIGRVVHRALAEWNCVGLPAETLAERLATLARREGVLTAPTLAHAVERTQEMLAVLRDTRLYGEIDTAAERHAEVPFVLQTARGELHGTIDLLYRDSKGRWRLLDWKTDWVAATEIAEHVARYRLQLAVYVHAARQALGVEPVASLCFLAAGGRVYTVSAAELAAELGDLV